MRALLTEAARLQGVDLDLDAEDLDAELAKLGHVADFMQVVLRNSANPTMFTAGYQTNVIPGKATARVDGRFLPGHGDEFFETLAQLCGDQVELGFITKQQPWETPYDGALVDAMTRSLLGSA